MSFIISWQDGKLRGMCRVPAIYFTPDHLSVGDNNSHVMGNINPVACLPQALQRTHNRIDFNCQAGTHQILRPLLFPIFPGFYLINRYNEGKLQYESSSFYLFKKILPLPSCVACRTLNCLPSLNTTEINLAQQFF